MRRTVLGHFVVGEPDPSGARECPTCLFDALLDFPVHVISEAGVSDFGSIAACARCYEED